MPILSCQNEIDAPLGIGDTFIKIISTDAKNEAIKAIETGEGDFMLLVNVSENDENPKRWIKLVKTDRGGNKIFSKSYFPSELESANPQLIANNFFPYNNGYLIIGDSINGPDRSLLIVHVDAQGTEKARRKIALTDNNFTLSGKGLFINENNEIYMLSLKSSKTDPTNKSAVIYSLDQELNTTQLATKELGKNISLSNELYFNEDQYFLFGGNYVSSSNTNLQFVELNKNNGSKYAPDIAGNPHFFIKEFQKINDRVIAIGEKSGNATFSEEVISDRIIYLNAPANSISATRLVELEVDDPSTSGPDAATGYSITPTQDGNFAILGAIGNEEDERELVFLKVGIDGNILQTNNGPLVRIYGGNGEKGATILETADGGYLLYGTTNFGGIESLLLIKINSNGDL